MTFYSIYIDIKFLIVFIFTIGFLCSCDFVDSIVLHNESENDIVLFSDFYKESSSLMFCEQEVIAKISSRSTQTIQALNMKWEERLAQREHINIYVVKNEAQFDYFGMGWHEVNNHIVGSLRLDMQLYNEILKNREPYEMWPEAKEKNRYVDLQLYFPDDFVRMDSLHAPCR